MVSKFSRQDVFVILKNKLQLLVTINSYDQEKGYCKKEM